MSRLRRFRPFIDLPGVSEYSLPALYQHLDAAHPEIGIISIPVTYPPSMRSPQCTASI